MASSQSTGSTSRADASRAALLAAFNELVVTRRYDDFGVTEIVSKADVSRSTFYEHFKSKDDLLRQSLTHVLAPLASVCEQDYDSKRLHFYIEHFLENRALALGLLNGPSSKQVVSLLANLVEQRLMSMPKRRPEMPMLLTSAQIAESQVGLLRAWLTRGGIEPASQIAISLVSGTQALVERLL